MFCFWKFCVCVVVLLLHGARMVFCVVLMVVVCVCMVGCAWFVVLCLHCVCKDFCVVLMVCVFCVLFLCLGV